VAGESLRTIGPKLDSGGAERQTAAPYRVGTLLERSARSSLDTRHDKAAALSHGRKIELQLRLAARTSKGLSQSGQRSSLR
jgi:hypothetical protein